MTVYASVKDFLARQRAANPITFTRIKVLRGYAEHSRFLSTLDDVDGNPNGYIPNQEIPSPYRYSPTHCVYAYAGMQIFIVETAHRRYEVFRIDSGNVRQDENFGD